MATHADDFDEHSAVEDYQNINLKRPMQKDGNSDEGGGETGGSSASTPTKVEGLGLRSPDMGLNNRIGAKQVKEEAGGVDKLRHQNKVTVRGREESAGVATRASGLGEVRNLNPDMLDEWVKQFAELAGPQGMDSLTENKLQRLLSKEILHEPLKEIAARYPKWIVDHKEKLGKEDYGRYSQQHEVILELIVVYERDPCNFKMIVELMQKMQECGQPPNDIIQELTPDINLSQLGQITASQPLY